MSLNSFITTAVKIGRKWAPLILMAAGTACTIDAIVKTPEAYEEANDAMIQEERDLGRPLTTTEKVKVCARPYLPVIAREGIGLIFFYSAFYMKHKRGAAIAAAYALLETERDDLENALRSRLSGAKYEEVKHEIMDKKIENAIKNPKYAEQLTVGPEEALGLYYEPNTGIIFKADPKKIDKAVKDLDETYGYDGYVALRDFFRKLNIDPPRVADYIGWTYTEGAEKHITYKTYDYHWLEKDLYITGLDFGLKLDEFVRTWW